MDIPLYRQWLKNPTVNPLTGRKIKIDGPIYRKYKNVCDRLGIGGTETITLPISSSTTYPKERYLERLREICYNTADPISMEEFEEMSAEQLSKLILIKSGEKHHAFLPETIITWFRVGNTKHPVTNMPIDRACISKILGNGKSTSYEIHVTQDGEWVKVIISQTPGTRLSRSRSAVVVFPDRDEGDYTTSEALVLLYELAERRIMPRRFSGKATDFVAYIDYMKKLLAH
jgi:hypothetical protein